MREYKTGAIKLKDSEIYAILKALNAKGDDFIKMGGSPDNQYHVLAEEILHTEQFREILDRRVKEQLC